MSTLKVNSDKDSKKQISSKIDSAASFRVVDKILNKWNCTPAEKLSIMGISKASFYRYKNAEKQIVLNPNQLERLSYIANIHQSLRMVFTNPDNVYGFMKMENNNPYFEGRTPLSLIATGSFGTLYEVFKRIDAMRSGQW